jgi:hypothetical protein
MGRGLVGEEERWLGFAHALPENAGGHLAGFFFGGTGTTVGPDGANASFDGEDFGVVRPVGLDGDVGGLGQAVGLGEFLQGGFEILSLARVFFCGRDG